MPRPLTVATSPPGTPAAVPVPRVARPVASRDRARELPHGLLFRHRPAIGHVTDTGTPAPFVVRFLDTRIHRPRGHAGAPRSRGAVAPVHAHEMN